MSPHHQPSIGIWLFCVYLCGFLSRIHWKSQWLLSSTEELLLLVFYILSFMFVQVIVNTVQDRCCSSSVGVAVAGRGWILAWLMVLVGLRACRWFRLDMIAVQVLKLMVMCLCWSFLGRLQAVMSISVWKRWMVFDWEKLDCFLCSEAGWAWMQQIVLVSFTCPQQKLFLKSSVDIFWLHASVKCFSHSWCISVSSLLPWDSGMTFSSVG